MVFGEFFAEFPDGEGHQRRVANELLQSLGPALVAL